MSGAAVFGNASPDENLQTQAVLVCYDGHSNVNIRPTEPAGCGQNAGHREI